MEQFFTNYNFVTILKYSNANHRGTPKTKYISTDLLTYLITDVAIAEIHRN